MEQTTTMHFRTHQNKGPTLPQFFFEDNIIPVSTGTKFLGIHINERVSWVEHCDSLKSKLNTGHQLIYRLKNITNPHVSRTVYFTCFHTHLRHGITVWGKDSHSRQIFVLQKKVVRLMCNQGGANGALAPGADLEGAPKRQSPTGHKLIRSTVAWYWLSPILMCFGLYICIFTLCCMFIAANIVGCRLRHQDTRCTHR
jgi:hypothetical protein